VVGGQMAEELPEDVLLEPEEEFEEDDDEELL
jgi:hypothetical protein